MGELGGDYDLPLPQRCSPTLDWCKLVYLESMGLSSVPEEASIDYDCDELSF